MTEVKVGDKVRLKTNSYKGMEGAEAFQPGAVGTITRVAQDPNATGADIEVDGAILYFFGSEYEALEYEGIKEGDRVRFEANTRDYAYSSDALPTAYNGIEGTVTNASPLGSTVSVKWDISEIGDRASFTENVVVIDRPAPARKTVVVEFDAPADENIENLVQQVTALTEVKYTIKEGN